jgi:N-acetylglucosaminyldiphosphoundecaprenol N-acetyl-beta-D-mannosaminyltransferase
MAVVNRIRILNADFDAHTTEQIIDQIISSVKSEQRGWLCTVNVAILMMMRSSPMLQNFVEKAKWVVADGQPLVWVAPIFRGRLPERVAGIELVDGIASEAEKEGFRIYLLGAEKKVVETVSAQLKRKYPKLNICGARDGYFSSDEAQIRADEIRNSDAQILFVGMGVPKQEEFIENQWERMGVNFAIGVGGSFDVIAGLRKRAPGFIQRIGFEWLYRLIQEPRRMWKRYLVTNSLFIFLVGKEIAARVISALGSNIDSKK